MRKFVIYFLLLMALSTKLVAQVDIYQNGELLGGFGTLQEAFAYINDGGAQGVIVLQITDNTSEIGTCILNASGSNGGLCSYSSVTIYPVVTGKTISGSLALPLIELNGADNVTFDGRLNATGSTIDLTITNSSTLSTSGTSTIRFVNDATNNIIKYCTLKGASTATTGGVLFFSTTTGSIGNDGNTIRNNNITSSSDVNRPVNVVYSLGTNGTSKENSGITISNNYFINFLNRGLSSNGINLSTYSSGWIITKNSFYETSTFIPTGSGAYNILMINNSGINYAISGNYIGGQDSLCGNGSWDKTNANNNDFYALNLTVGSGTASSVQNNTINNITWSNSGAATWSGINIGGGDVNIGTSTGNTIGASSGTGSITLTDGGNNANVYGINIASGGTVTCNNNNIGSITATNLSVNATNFYGINKEAVGGTTTISNNTIGSTSTAYSINASSASTNAVQSVFGISNNGTGIITINNNIIANLINSTLASGLRLGVINGIRSTDGTTSISSNTVRNLTNTNVNASPSIASVCGLALSGITTPKTISGNIIYNLCNTYASFNGSIVGIAFTGNQGSNSVNNNFIHSLSYDGTSFTAAANIYGIKISAGAATYSNNIISLGGGTNPYSIYGISETGIAGDNNNFYFNTVYIFGGPTTGSKNSFCINSGSILNSRDLRNNIFYNARTNNGATGTHYSIYIASTGGTIICDYNDYYASGTGGVLGYYGGNTLSLPIVPGQDVSSFADDPLLSSAGGTSAGNYLASEASLVAVTGTGITNDYAFVTRSATFPSMGAYEYTVAPGSWTWTGTTSTNWGTTSNWNYNTVPTSSSYVIITNVTNLPIVDEASTTPAQSQNLTINSGSVLTISAGKALKVNGTLTNSAGNTGLVIKSDAHGNDGKLINNTPGVSGTVELYLNGGIISGAPRFHYFVPPVSSITIGSTIADVKTNLGLTYFNGDLMSYSESAAGSNKNNGYQYFDGYNSTAPFSSLLSTMGYNIYINNTLNDKIIFKGTLNASAHNFTLNYSVLGFNLVGNPYPCNYDLGGITALSSPTPDAVDNTIYFRKDGGLPAVWNVQLLTGETGYSNIVAPMQGFFVQVTGASSLSLPVGSKTTGTAAPLRSKGLNTAAPAEVKKIKLVLTNDLGSDETIVCLVDKATPGFDGNFDAYKLFDIASLESSIRINPANAYKLPDSGPETSFIYTDLNSVKYAINSVPGPDTKTPTVIIPVSLVINTPGTYKIDITEFDNLEGLPVFLKHGDVVTNLSKDVSYTFTTDKGTFTDFQLIIGASPAPKPTETITDEVLKTWYSKNYVYINCPAGLTSYNGKLSIYDMQGKLVYTSDPLFITTGQTIQVPVNLPKGLYITRLLFNNQPYVSKIVVL